MIFANLALFVNLPNPTVNIYHIYGNLYGNLIHRVDIHLRMSSKAKRKL